MKRLLLFVLLLSAGAVTELQAGPIRLTMADAIKTAVEKNLDLQVERYNPAQQEAELQKSLGLYNPVLSLQASYNDTTSYSANLASNRYWSQTTQLNLAEALVEGALN